MPSLTGKGSSALGAVGTVRNFMNLVKEIDFDEVRERAEQPPRTLIVAADSALAEEAARRIFGDSGRIGVDLRTWNDGDSIDGVLWDAIVVYDPNGVGILDKVRKSVGARQVSQVFFLPRQREEGGDAAEQLRSEVTSELPDLAPSYGRLYPDWRPAAVKALVDETSKANAQFALVSNIPAVVPFLGGVIAASADLIVLTKNQVMMAYKIAAAHDRNLNNQMAIIRELMPVVGAGFLWRTVAREASSFIPLAAGTIPKVAIAYMGTMITGRTVDYYYRFGKKPTKEQLKAFAAQAGEAAKKLPLPGKDEDGETPNGEAPAVAASSQERDVTETQKIDVAANR